MFAHCGVEDRSRKYRAQGAREDQFNFVPTFFVPQLYAVGQLF
jgi:hypothetical protein